LRSSGCFGFIWVFKFYCLF